MNFFYGPYLCGELMNINNLCIIVTKLLSPSFKIYSPERLLQTKGLVLNTTHTSTQLNHFVVFYIYTHNPRWLQQVKTFF